jgi:hypothetical protein
MVDHEHFNRRLSRFQTDSKLLLKLGEDRNPTVPGNTVLPGSVGA